MTESVRNEFRAFMEGAWNKRNVPEGPEYSAEYFGRFRSASTEGHHEALGLMGPIMAGARERGGVPLQVGLVEVDSNSTST